MNIITLNHKNVNQFWKLRLCLLRELGEISTETNLTDLETVLNLSFNPVKHNLYHC